MHNLKQLNPNVSKNKKKQAFLSCFAAIVFSGFGEITFMLITRFEPSSFEIRPENCSCCLTNYLITDKTRNGLQIRLKHRISLNFMQFQMIRRMMNHLESFCTMEFEILSVSSMKQVMNVTQTHHAVCLSQAEQ